MATILVVDDEEALAWVVAHVLRKAGHTPLVAATGAAALRDAVTHPDLILLDLGLPDLPGAEVLRRLQADPATARIPVVIVSGEPDAAALVAGSGPRAVAAILRKPLQLAELCAVVAAVLAAPGAWTAPTGPPPALRVPLIYRLVTEGSNALVRQVCHRLEADRAQQWGSVTPDLPSWADLARLATREGLLSAAEGTLLAAEPAALVAA